MEVTYWKDGKIATRTVARFGWFDSLRAHFITKSEAYCYISKGDLISIETESGKLISYLGLPRVIYGMDKEMKYKDFEPVLEQIDKDIADLHQRTKDPDKLKPLYDYRYDLSQIRHMLKKD